MPRFDPAEFWIELRGRRVVPPAATVPLVAAADDAEDMLDDDEGDNPPAWSAQSVTGRNVVIAYLDSKGMTSTRQILCRRIDRQGDHRYLMANCLLRQKLRQFRCDRIASVIDPGTGEIFEPGSTWIDLFDPDSTSAARFHYGLSPRQYADFNAALNILTFMARCDGDWHPLEAERIEDFATAYWMRAEIAADLDLDEVGRHAARLAPDAESFWVALHRCAGSRLLGTIIRRHIAAVIAADGVIHEKEFYWGRQVDQFLSA